MTNIVIGQDQSGKTSLALSAPDPLIYLTFDPDNVEGVIQNYRHRRIKWAAFEIPKGLVKTKELGRIAAEERGRIEKAIIGACDSGKIATIVIDTETDMWECWRFGEFEGKQSDIGYSYVDLNRSYKGLLQYVQKKGLNLILIDRVSVQYKDNKPTNKWKRDGYKHLGFINQLTVECRYDEDVEDGFSLRIDRCRPDASLNGTILDADDIGSKDKELEGRLDWVRLAMMVKGGKEKDWRRQ